MRRVVWHGLGMAAAAVGSLAIPLAVMHGGSSSASSDASASDHHELLWSDQSQSPVVDVPFADRDPVGSARAAAQGFRDYRKLPAVVVLAPVKGSGSVSVPKQAKAPKAAKQAAVKAQKAPAAPKQATAPKQSAAQPKPAKSAKATPAPVVQVTVTVPQVAVAPTAR